MATERTSQCNRPYAPIATSLAAAQTTPAPTAVDWNAVREDFPWLKRRLWLTAADYHPICRRSIEAMERHIRYRGYDVWEIIDAEEEEEVAGWIRRAPE